MTAVESGERTRERTVADVAPDLGELRGALWPGSPNARRRPERLAKWIRVLTRESSLLNIPLFGFYVFLAALLNMVYKSEPGDAVSRMANGFYVVFSRDPHVAAIGFVWNPLMSILDIIPLLFKGIWPALSQMDMAGGLVTAFCMTGAVHQLRWALREWGVGRTPRLVLTVLFALNPMILYNSANGMSEALYLFTLVATTRYLLRWIRDDDLRSLVYAATWLALGYLARNEVAGSALLGTALVVLVSFSHAKGERKPRIMIALTDATLFVLPCLTAFVGWATASFIITGQPFQQFSSQYGNTEQIKIAGLQAGHYGVRILREIKCIEYLAPLLPVILVVALVAARHRRDARIFVPMAALGGSLAFSMVGYLGNSVFPWLRFYILIVPISILLVGSILATQGSKVAFRTRGDQPTGARGDPFGASKRRLGWRMGVGALTGCVAMGFVAPSLVTSWRGMMNPNIGLEETQFLGFIFHKHLTKEDRTSKAAYGAVTPMVNYLNGLNATNGDVIADTFATCIPNLVTRVNNSRIFVITNDRDFQRVEADPLTFGARYIMDPDPVGLDTQDATNVEFPTLFKTGAGFTTLVHNFPAAGDCPEFHLYRVIGHPTEA